MGRSFISLHASLMHKNHTNILHLSQNPSKITFALATLGPYAGEIGQRSLKGLSYGVKGLFLWMKSDETLT